VIDAAIGPQWVRGKVFLMPGSERHVVVESGLGSQ